MRILLVTPVLPWPAEVIGAAQRTRLLQRALRTCGDVDLALLGSVGHAAERLSAGQRRELGLVAYFPIPPARQAGWWQWPARWLPRRFAWTCQTLAEQAGLYALVPEARRWLDQQLAGRRYDLIVCRYLQTALQLGLPRERRVPSIVDVDDVDWRKLESQLAAHPWPGWRGSVVAWMLRTEVQRRCRRVLRRFAHLWLSSPADLRALPGEAVSVLPNVPFRADSATGEEPAPSDPDSRTLLFVGTLDYAPNCDGLERFLKCVWPHVRAAEPEAKVRIVGVRLAPEIRERWARVPGVDLAGFVADLAPEYARAAFAVAPVYWGGGSNIKVLDALANGRTCVAATHALRGFQEFLRHDESVWHAATDAEFAEGCVSLLRDPERREALARAGVRAVATHADDREFTAVVAATLAGVLGTREDLRRVTHEAPCTAASAEPWADTALSGEPAAGSDRQR